MKPMDDIWKDITTLPSPTTNHFQIFIPPAHHPPPLHPINLLPPPPSTSTILTLLPPTTSSIHQDPPTDNRLNPNPPPPATTPSQPQHSEKFRRLMKNRESAARSRARKQARAEELEIEVRRLAKENAKLKRLQKQVCASHVPKESRLNRTKSAPF